MTTLPLLQLHANQIQVWADLHLHEDQADEIQDFAKQICAVADSVDAVVVLGDLFDAWVGREMWSYPAFQPLLDAFQQLKRKQIRLILVRGNRDVLMNPADVGVVHAELADRILWRQQANSKAILLSHGDEYCLNDLPYQRLRRSLRRPLIRTFLRILPHRLRKAIAARMRGHSERAVGRKPMDMMALDESAVESALKDVGAVGAVIGHLHQERRQELAEGRFLQVLPAWEPGAAAWPGESAGMRSEEAAKA